MKGANSFRNSYDSLWIILFVIEIIVLTWCAMTCEGLLENFLMQMAVWTARASLVFFSTYFLHVSTCLPTVYKTGQREEVFTLLLIFAIAHGIHGIFLWSNILYNKEFSLKIINLIAGTLAYIMILSAPFYWKKKGDEEQFRTYFFVYMPYYVWFIFMMTYFSRLSDVSRLDKFMYYIFGTLTLGLGIIATWNRLKSDKKR